MNRLGRQALNANVKRNLQIRVLCRSPESPQLGHKTSSFFQHPPVWLWSHTIQDKSAGLTNSRLRSLQSAVRPVAVQCTLADGNGRSCGGVVGYFGLLGTKVAVRKGDGIAFGWLVCEELVSSELVLGGLALGELVVDHLDPREYRGRLPAPHTDRGLKRQHRLERIRP